MPDCRLTCAQAGIRHYGVEMLIYLVTAEISRARELIALSGWRVLVDLEGAVEEINEWWMQKARGKTSLSPALTYTNRRAPSIFMTEVDEDVLDQYNWSSRTARWPSLREPVKGWRRLDVDTYTAWSVEQALIGRKKPTMEAAWIGTLVRPRGTMSACPPKKSRRVST